MEILEILAWIVILFFVIMGFIVIFSSVIEFIYRSLFTEKRFNFFLQEVERDPLLKTLLKEIGLRNINLAPFGLFDELLWQRKAAMTAIPMEITISNKIIKQFLAGKLDSKLLALALAHELGHINQSPLEEEVRKICKYQRQCLYAELRATKEGYLLLEKISGKEIKEIFPQNYVIYLTQKSREQCKKCINQGILEDKCPKIEKLKEAGVEIEANKKLTFAFSTFIKP